MNKQRTGHPQPYCSDPPHRWAPTSAAGTCAGQGPRRKPFVPCKFQKRRSLGKLRPMARYARGPALWRPAGECDGGGRPNGWPIVFPRRDRKAQAYVSLGSGVNITTGRSALLKGARRPAIVNDSSRANHPFRNQHAVTRIASVTATSWSIQFTDRLSHRGLKHRARTRSACT